MCVWWYGELKLTVLMLLLVQGYSRAVYWNNSSSVLLPLSQHCCENIRRRQKQWDMPNQTKLDCLTVIVSCYCKLAYPRASDLGICCFQPRPPDPSVSHFLTRLPDPSVSHFLTRLPDPSVSHFLPRPPDPSVSHFLPRPPDPSVSHFLPRPPDPSVSHFYPGLQILVSVISTQAY